jgi:hypothetical protein
MPTVTTEVQVDVDLEDFDDDDLIEEIESRGSLKGLGSREGARAVWMTERQRSAVVRTIRAALASESNFHTRRHLGDVLADMERLPA